MEDFQRMAWDPGWKYEYIDGRVHVRPQEACDRHDCAVHAYVLMTNLVHLLISKRLQCAMRFFLHYELCYTPTLSSEGEQPWVR
jgi:REP element-mobilizing transposase RayT